MDNNKLLNLECDKAIANELNITLDFYQKYLIDNFNAWMYKQPDCYEMYFKNTIDVVNAAKWVQSVLIASKLTK
jgi:hypothetical protein